MEDESNDLENLFNEYEAIIDEDLPDDRGRGKEDEAEEIAPKKVPAPKRIIKNPRLKFNPERLCGERGIPVLSAEFENIKFKGKGHEKEDLNKLMTVYEHWCHRLFPSMKFADCLRQIEKLGKKRPVQTCLRKIRLDMPILSDDFVRDEEDKNDEVIEGNENEPEQDTFDTLLAETPSALQGNDVPLSNLEDRTSTPIRPSGNVLGSSFGSTLTEEQRQRMEYNKILAAERRKARLAAAYADATMDHSSKEGTTIIIDDRSGLETTLEIGQEANTNSSVGGDRSCTIKQVQNIDEVNPEIDMNEKELSEKSDVETQKLGKNATDASVSNNTMELQEPLDKDSSIFDCGESSETNTCRTDIHSEQCNLDELMELVDEDD